MDEDNNDTPRVTRARTRRMSALEHERPLTPQLDIIAERASPRPTRRNRLNSSTIDLRTPVRSTRLSLARGESLEPITPTAASLSTTKRPTRTPAKSGRKQLTLQEEVQEEDASEVVEVKAKRSTATAAKSVRKQLTLQEDVKEEQAASTDKVVGDVPKVEAKPSARTPAKQAESTDTKMAVVEEVAEVVVESTPTRSGPIVNESTPPSDDRPVTRSMSKTPPVRVTRSMSKTPPARGRSANNTPVNTQNSPKMEPKRSNKKQIKDTTVSEQPQMQSTEAKNDKCVTEPHVEVESMEIDEEEIIDKSKSESNSNVNESLVVATTPKVILIEQNIPEQMKELNEIIPEQNEEPAESESNKENIQHFDEIVPSSENKDKIDPKSSSVDVEDKLEPSTVHTELYQLDASLVNDDVGANITVTDDIRLTDVAIVTKVIRLPDLTPTTKGLLMEQSGSESRKTVAFNDGMHVDDDTKQKYPKTPARLNEPPVKSVNLITGKNENETPLKRLLKGRNSSTPVTKSQVLLSQADEPKTPPLQIDVIQPFSALKDEDNNISLDLPITTAKLSRRLLSEDENEVETENNTHGNRSVRYSDDEYDDAEDATSHDRSNCEFFDMEAECIEDYQSGDSMNSSERREVVENEIPHDGESVGSQDTPDEHSEEEDSAEEKMSFIVTDSEEGVDDQDDDDDDDDGDAVNDDDDGGDIECLCFSSASEESVFDPDEEKPKKYRRIISNDSSDDDDDDEQINNMEIKTDDKEVKVTEKQVNKSVSSVEEEEEEEKQLPIKTPSSNSIESEKAEINGVVKLNGEDEEMEVEELVFSSDDENDSPKSKKNISNNKSIYEVLDSCDDESDQMNITAGPIADNLNLTAKKEKPSEPNEKPSDLDDDEKPLSTSHQEPSSTESVATVHEKQKRSGEEEALLAEISSCDLSHLHQMFNPLQKSRRQTLYVQDVPVTTKEPKLKRRSVQLNSDVQPSQSFIETLAEEKRQQSKRKHMSKSFCGAADDDGLDVSGGVVEEVQRKKARKSCEQSEVARIDVIEPDVEAAKDEAKLSPSKEEKELPAAADQEEENMPVAQDEPELETKLTPTKVVMKSSPVTQMDTNENQPDQKNRNFYLDYCDSILQAANEAKLQQKKQRVASNKKIKCERPASVTDDAIDTTASTSTATVHQEKAKKDLKRLQATKQAFKHAVKLLVPEKAITGDAIDIATLKLEKVKIEKDLERLQALKQAVKHSEQLLVPEIAITNRPASVTGDAIDTTPSTSTATVSLEKAKIKKDLKRLQANKPPVKQLLVPEINNQPQQSQSLARKLSSQPDAKTKAGKTKRKLNKKKKQKLMTQLSSGEESRNGPYRFRNNAGMVTVTKCGEDGSSEDDDIITNSGIVKVEPCTPMPKYFKEIPVTPVGSGFRSEPNKKKPKAEHSAATAAALRFKMKMFGGDK